MDTRRKAGPFRSRTAGIAAPRSFRRAFVRRVRSTRPARSCLLRSEETDVYRRTRAALGDPASPREERSRQTDTRDEVVGERGGGTERPGCRSGRGRSGGRTGAGESRRVGGAERGKGPHSGSVRRSGSRRRADGRDADVKTWGSNMTTPRFVFPAPGRMGCQSLRRGDWRENSVC